VDVMVVSSEIIVSRPVSAKQARPLSSITMLVLRSGKLGCTTETVGFEHIPPEDFHELSPARAYISIP